MRIFWIVAAVCLTLMLTGCGSSSCQHDTTAIEFIKAPGAELAKLPFSEAVRVGKLLFLSGQIGTLPGTTDLVPGGIKAETRQVLENVKTVLERNRSSLDRVVKCTVFLLDIEEWPNMNEVYMSYFPTNPPARSALAATGLALGARVEIECIAVVKDCFPSS